MFDDGIFSGLRDWIEGMLGSGTDIDQTQSAVYQVIANLSRELPYIEALVLLLAVVIGVYMIAEGINGLTKQDPQKSPFEPIVIIVIGGLTAGFPILLDWGSRSFFGGDAYFIHQMEDYLIASDGAEQEQAALLVRRALLGVIIIAGLVGCLSALITWKNMYRTREHGQVASAFKKFVGGLLCVNIVMVLDMIGNSASNVAIGSKFIQYGAGY